MKILTVFGTRPEAIKMALLVKKLSLDKNFTHKICVTGQHREMLDQVLSLFSIEPDYDLNLMKENQTLHHITSEILLKMRGIFDDFKPDLVLVHGDTTTTFATTLAAFYSGIKVGHVEAGMRTGNIYLPFPEEANRVLTDKLATYYFAPTKQNVVNLINEGATEQNILETGNTVIDSLLYIASQTREIPNELKQSGISGLLENKILLVTGHRRENIGDGLTEICKALIELSEKYKNLHIVYPVHPNPNVRKTVFDLLKNNSKIHLIEPLSYPSFVYLMKKSYIILTDSGGIQEEAPSLGIPVLVMRNETERQEAVKAGTVKLVGTDKKNIVNEVSALLDNEISYSKMTRAINPYGDGKATEKIIDFLKKLKRDENNAKLPK